MKILLDYLFPITAIEPTPAASTAFLKQVCVVANPKSGQEGNVGEVFECTSMAAVADRIDSAGDAYDEVQELFDAGMSRVYILLATTLDMADALAAGGSDFYTILISSDFDDEAMDADGTSAVAASLTVGDLTFTAKTAGTGGNSLSIALTDECDDAGEEVAHVTDGAIVVLIKTAASTAQQIKDAIDDSIAVSALISVTIADGEAASAQAAAAEDDFEGGAAASGGEFDLGDFTGVVGVSSSDDEFLEAQAAIPNRCAFHVDADNGAKNMFYAFGKLLSNALAWRNQQYIPVPRADDVDELGEAEALFDDRVSFVISDSEFSNRLGFFACGGKAIAAPYIVKNLQIDMQSAALSYIAGNQPAYTKTEAALLEDELQKVIDSYIEQRELEAGTVEVSLVEDNFVASGAINISEPKALWKIVAEMRQSL